MGDGIGTRSKQNFCQGHPDNGHESQTHTRDVGMAKRVSGSFTFTAADGRITGSNGDFAAFVFDDPLLIAGTNLNDEHFQVTGLDATNQAYLVLDRPPKDEGPVSAVVRTE